MKKHLKRLAVTVTVLFAFLGAGFSVAFATGYVNWGGTDDYNETLDNLNAIEQGITSKEEYITYLTEENNKLTDKNTELQGTVDNSTSNEEIKNGLIEIINTTNDVNGPKHKYDSLKEALNKHAEDYKVEATTRLGEHGQGTSDKQLEQAEEDMEHVKERSETILESMDELPELPEDSEEGD